MPRTPPRRSGLGLTTVLPTPAGPRYGKNGGVAGISTFVEHDPGGVDWVLLFNGSGPKKGPDALAQAIPQIRQAVHDAQQWPKRDLFEQGWR